MIRSARVLPFDSRPAAPEQQVGRVHRDGSITFRGRTYATLKQVPAECLALLPDLETYREWTRIYRAIAPFEPWPRPRAGWTVLD